LAVACQLDAVAAHHKTLERVSVHEALCRAWLEIVSQRLIVEKEALKPLFGRLFRLLLRLVPHLFDVAH
jgi:hypothetical protein